MTVVAEGQSSLEGLAAGRGSTPIAAPPADGSARRARDARGPLLAAAAVLLVALAAIDDLPVGAMHDDAMYVVLAKAIATGHGFRWINLPGAPAATHFPPGYPAVLAALWRFIPEFPANLVAFKILNAALLAAAAAGVAVLARRRLALSEARACALAVVASLAVPVLVLGTVVMSEMLFLALLVPALLVADEVVAQDRPSLARVILVGCAGGALMLVRTHGIAYVAAVALAFLARRNWRAMAMTTTAAIAVVLPWQLWQWTHAADVPAPLRGDYGSYAGWLAGGAGAAPLTFAARTIGATSRELFAMLAGLTTAALPTVPLRLAAVVAAIVLIGAGLIRLFRAGARATSLFIAAYVAIILLWPFTPARFLWGIWPLIVVCFAAGALTLWRRASVSPRPRLAHAVALCAAALPLIGYGVYTARGYSGRWWSSIPRATAAAAMPTITWIGPHTRPTDVIATNVELMAYLYTGRQAVPATRFTAADYFAPPGAPSRAGALRSILRTYRIDAVAIVANDSLELAARRLAAEPRPALSLRDSVPHGLILTPTDR